MKTRSFRFSRNSGFTLLEMVITMVIFLLLSGAVFGIITGVLESTSSLHDNQDRRDQIAALNAFLKKKLGDLTVTDRLTSYQRGGGEGLAQNGIIFGEIGSATAIDAKLQANGYYTLRLGFTSHASSAQGQSGGGNANGSLFLIPDGDGVDASAYDWTPLIHDIKTLHWKFQNLDTGQWADQWIESSTKPNIVEFSMQIAGDLQPVTMDFWLPRITSISPAISPPGLSPLPAPSNAP